MGSAVLQLHVRRGPPHDDGVARARARVELATLALAVARARCRACARLRAHTAFWPLQVANKSAQRRQSKCTRRQRKRCRNGRHSIDKEEEEDEGRRSRGDERCGEGGARQEEKRGK